MRRIVIGTVVALGIAGSIAGPASAAGHHHTRYKPTVLALRTSGSVTGFATLSCNPTGGTHPHAVDACTQIATAKGDFDNLPGRQTFAACPMIFNPVTAVAKGVYQGKKVNFSKQFPNECLMLQATGSVFEFDE